MQKSTRPANPGDSRKWFLVDAKDQVLGRLAVVIANKLRAKDTPSFDPSVDAGAFVIVVNAAQVKLTGKKEQQKDYQRYSGYRDGLKHFTAATMRRLHPEGGGLGHAPEEHDCAQDDDASEGVRGPRTHPRGAEAGSDHALRRFQEWQPRK